MSESERAAVTPKDIQALLKTQMKKRMAKLERQITKFET